MVAKEHAGAAAPRDPKMGAEKLIIRSEKVRFIDILSLLLLRRPITSYPFVDVGDQTALDVGSTPGEWLVALTELIQKALAAAYYPAKWIGVAVEFLLNFLALNARGKLVIPFNREAPNFRSMIALIDGRTELKPGKQQLQVVDLESSGEAADLESGGGCAAPLIRQQYLDGGGMARLRDLSTFDVTAMAAKIAYENAAYIENVVNNVWKLLEQVHRVGDDAGVRDDGPGQGREHGGAGIPGHGAVQHAGLVDGREPVVAGHGPHGARPRRLPQGARSPGGGRQGRRPRLPQGRPQQRRRQEVRLLRAPLGAPETAQEAPQRARDRHGAQPGRRARRRLPGAAGAARGGRHPGQDPRRADLRAAARRGLGPRQVPRRVGAGDGLPADGVPVRRGAAGAVRRAAGRGVRARRDVRVLRRVVRLAGARRRRPEPELLRPEVPAVHVRQRVGGPVQGDVPVDEGGARLPGGGRVAALPRHRPSRPRHRLAQPPRLPQRRPPRPCRAQASLN